MSGDSTDRAEEANPWKEDPVVIEWGGILPIEELSELEQLNWSIVSDLMGEAIATMNRTDLRTELIRLEVHLINSPDINAFVRVAKPGKIIGLCRGIICQQWNLLATLLAHPSIFEEYFNDKPSIDESQWRNDLQTQLLSLRQHRAQPAYIPHYISTPRGSHTHVLWHSRLHSPPRASACRSWSSRLFAQPLFSVCGGGNVQGKCPRGSSPSRQ
jgi:hypothetical protein